VSNVSLKEFYKWIKWMPCAACGAPPPCDAAHVRSIRSDKTGRLLPRSHKGRAAWGVIPLCRECHMDGKYSIHNVGEARFAADNSLVYGQWVATYLVMWLEHVMEQEDEDDGL